MAALPGWDSLERVTWWGNLFQILGLLALALLVVFDVLAFIYGQRKDALVERQAAPRSLTSDQKSAISAFLLGQPTGAVVIKATVNASDARAYAEEIADLLREAGWTARIDNAIFTRLNTSGVWITVKDPNKVPPAAGLLQQALQTAGIPARGEYDPTMGAAEDEVWLSVGTK